MEDLLARIARKAGSTELVEMLSERLSASELTSLLLEVAARSAGALKPSDVRRQYEGDRFVRPSHADPRLLNAIERAAFDAAVGFEAITPAPLAPLAACASVATVSQNKIVSTMRGSEV